MKTKTFSILFALVMVLSMAVGVFAQDFDETWDENTVLTVFNDLDMYYPDMFADEDSDFLWTDNGPKDFEQNFPSENGKIIAKAPLSEDPADSTMTASFDPCGDGLIKYDMTITKSSPNTDSPWLDTQDYYYGDRNTTYIRGIDATLTVNGDDASSSFKYKLGVKTCGSTGGDECHSVSFKKVNVKQDDGTTVKKFQAHLKGYLTVPGGLVMTAVDDYQVDMSVDFSTYMTALWPVDNTDMYYGLAKDFGTVTATASTADETMKANTKKNYCQPSLQTYDAFGYNEALDLGAEGMIPSSYSLRAKYDENTGEARLQVVVRNVQPDVRRQNYVIPAEVFAFNSVDVTADPVSFVNGSRITGYTCKYTLYNVANAAPRTDYCKFGEGIAIPNHGLVRIDITIDHLSGALLREAAGAKIPFVLRLGGMLYSVAGEFEAVDFPCPPVSRMQVMDPIKPFMTFYGMLSDGAISPSGAYGVYEGGVWGMYQKCGKLAYMAVRLKNDGIQEEVVNLNNVAVAVNGGTPMSWKWVLSSQPEAEKGKIELNPGEDVVLIGRAKVTDYGYQMNSDLAITGAVNFLDYGFYIQGKVYSDHNNTNCTVAP